MALSACVPQRLELCIDNKEGTLPVDDPDSSGQLIYPIELNGTKSKALLDHGASTCFIDVSWAEKLGADRRLLRKPLRLVEFSGTTSIIREEVRIRDVGFARVNREWYFLMSPRAPYLVVIGLDLIRSWPLYYNPCNDRIITISPNSSAVIPLDPPSLVDVLEGDLPQEGPSEVSSFPSTLGKHCSTTHASYATLDPLEADDRDRPEAISHVTNPICMAELDENGVVVVTCYSVTASSQDERKALREFVEGLPKDLYEVVNEYLRLFSPPDAFPPLREVVHDIKLKPGVLPVRRPPYPLGEAKLQAIKTQVQELFRKGWIVPSSSPWARLSFSSRKKEIGVCVSISPT